MSTAEQNPETLPAFKKRIIRTTEADGFSRKNFNRAVQLLGKR